MALPAGTIAEVNSLNESIGQESSTYCTNIQNKIDELEGNGEFQKFVQGTDVGQKMFNQLKQLNEQLGLLSQQQASLHSETKSFLNNQTRINSVQ